jgi:hypothetical protein
MHDMKFDRRAKADCFFVFMLGCLAYATSRAQGAQQTSCSPMAARELSADRRALNSLFAVIQIGPLEFNGFREPRRNAECGEHTQGNGGRRQRKTPE